MPGHGVLHRADDVEVEVAVEGRVDTALQAHLGRPALSRLDGPLGDVVEGEQVRRAPQVQRQRPLGEPAERALEGAHVGVVDVAVHHVGDGVADHVAPDLVGCRRDRGHLGATGAEQGDDLRLADLLPGRDTLEDLGDGPLDPSPGLVTVAARPPRPTVGGRVGGPRRRSTRRSSGGRSGSTSAPVPTLAAAWCRSGHDRARVVATQRLRIRPVQHREPGRLVQPTRGRPRRTRGRPSAAAPAPAHVPRSPHAARRWPARAVPGSHGRSSPGRRRPSRRSPHPAANRAGPGRTGSAAPGRVHRRAAPAGPARSPADAPHGRARRVVAHRRARLGQEVLHDHLLHVTMPTVRRRRSPPAPRSGPPRSHRCRPGCRW